MTAPLTSTGLDGINRAEPAVKSSADHSGWWLLPAIIAGAGIWAALIWWAPVAAGVLAVAVGAVVLWGL